MSLDSIGRRNTGLELGWEAAPELWGPPSDETLVSVAAKCRHAPECTIVITPRPKPKPDGVVQPP
ncbi:hypothetical protein ACIPSA_24530 [Streptomyces sp. NPDC086549]|uniref:hypothetical protein n=1 Tax=Streptomyces sp. NPDC086549 TaxID=3365752 RepID=UPI00381C8400